MARITLTRQAREDLSAIWSYIAKDKPDAADHTLDTINNAIERTSSHSPQTSIIRRLCEETTRRRRRGNPESRWSILEKARKSWIASLRLARTSRGECEEVPLNY